jgi:hypothetical protein
MANVRKFLDLSTAHLAQEDKRILERASVPGECNTFGPPSAKHTYGWWMFAPEELDGYREAELSNNLRRICTYARTCGCDYILFDSDAEINKNLPVFEDCCA